MSQHRDCEEKYWEDSGEDVAPNFCHKRYWVNLKMVGNQQQATGNQQQMITWSQDTIDVCLKYSLVSLPCGCGETLSSLFKTFPTAFHSCQLSPHQWKRCRYTQFVCKMLMTKHTLPACGSNRQNHDNFGNISSVYRVLVHKRNAVHLNDSAEVVR